VHHAVIPQAPLILAVLGLVVFADLTAGDFQRLRRARGWFTGAGDAWPVGLVPATTPIVTLTLPA
jgi:FtsH-binding integral membrane protein